MSAYFRRRLVRDRPLPPVQHRDPFAEKGLNNSNLSPRHPVTSKIKPKKSDKRRPVQLDLGFPNLAAFWRVR